MMKKSLSLLFLLLAFSAAAQPKLSPDNIDEILQAILWLDGEKLLDLDRDGGGRMETWAKLDNGYHRLEVQYWDNFMEESVAVGLKGPGISVENLPAEILYHE